MYVLTIAFIIAFQLCILVAFASKSRPTSVNISVSFADVSQNDTLTLIFFQDVLSEQLAETQEGEVFQTTANKKTGYFHFDFATNKKSGYISLYKERGHNGFPIFLLDLYLVESGDSVLIDIRKLTPAREFNFKKGDTYYTSIYKFPDLDIQFSGKGSAKFQCRHEADLVTAMDSTSNIIFDSTGNYIFENAAKVALQKSLVVVDKYRSLMSVTAAELLTADLMGKFKQSLLHMATISITYDISTWSKDWLNKAIFKADEFFPLNPANVISSKSYLYLLVYREMLRAIQEGKKPEDAYWQIKARYAGTVRDKMLAILLVKQYDKLPKPALLLGDALSICKDSFSLMTIRELNNTLVKGSPAYNFKLVNTEGKIVRLDDFKGKVIMLDFYFTGCGACGAYFQYGLLPAEEFFRNNDQVVFISVSIDEDKELWLHTVNAGKFTSSSSINLYTNGKGVDDPVIKHYKVRGYPHPILIDKNGRIFSTSDTELRTSGSQHLIARINEALRVPVDN